ncbi:L-ribulose-5-phosphate 4-epimerase AraD [Brucella gallinifaecis]|uniref:L-ribulose-5-phosphate 4-epimerase n=1 Tax=Brucella gallinifaecis TaxID=215590 RepID=A0A502BLS6_9HYPH|nr:L-ribulose-5-phosphate 4-epimerase AraD [Brucella gallinifaecis]TPF74266.1 L-ribulose-5-phosphate 4-epimerase AraD [Brucella gallinifaecis]
MDLNELKKAVLEANLATVREGLVLSTFGNVSGIDRESGRIVIKPSGVEYDKLSLADLVVTDLDGNVIEGKLKPSSDLLTHLVLYKTVPAIGAVVHTHSTYATIFAQSQRSIPAFGTTHADYFHGTIPVTRLLTDEEIRDRYVEATGHVVVEALGNYDPMSIPAALVAGHGPFVWGNEPADAVHNALILEEVARLAWHTISLNPDAQPISQSLLDRHYLRKHGDNASYGQ